MKSFSKKSLVLGVMLAIGATAQAAYLGQLQVTSQAGQNFQATFLVHDVSPTGTSLTARLAPAETYAKYGITMPQTAKGLNLALISKSPLTLRITANRPAVERAFPLLVELNEGGRVTVRQYNIHIGATGSVEPVEVVAMGSAVATQAQPATPPKATEKPAVREAKPVSQEAMTPLERMQAKNYDLSKPVLIEAGYTPWSLGVLYQKRYPNASVNQVLVALAIQNPEAFPAGNVRQLKAGAKVTAPSASLVESIDAQTAREIVQKGLNIEEVAQRPAPIEKPKAKKPAASVKPAPVKEVKESKEVKEAPVVEEVVPPPAAVTPPAAPQGDLTPADKAAEPDTSEAPSAVEPPPEPVAPNDATVTEQEPSPQDAMPTLEIMTEEQAPVEEESSSWFWYLLIVLMLGAAGFIYWRTKQGRYVDFQSFKKVMNKGRAPVREEPVVRQAPRSQQAPQPSVARPVETINHAPRREEPRAAVQPAPVKPAPTVAAPQEPIKPVQPAPSANVFDLVADDEPVEVKPAAVKAPEQPKAQPSVDDHGMKDSLDMARSFISIGAKNEAIALLQEVLQKGSSADKAQAEALLKQIHERG